MDHITASQQVLEAHIDYLTATARPGLPTVFLLTAVNHWFEQREKAGFTASTWAAEGYRGRRVDGITVGERKDGLIVRLSGHMARDHARQTLPFVGHVSRIDVQVTLQDPNPGFPWHDEVKLIAARDARVRAGQTSVTYIDRLPDGRSCYIGSRSSDRYYRVYDKTAESKGAYPPGCWRWEIEYKKARAGRVAEHLTKHQCSPETVRFIVGRAFFDYGIRPPMEMLTRNWTDAGIRYETDDARRLAWLKTSVAPMLRRMEEAMSRDELRDALGLNDDDVAGPLSRVDVDELTGEVLQPQNGTYEPVGWGEIDPW